MLGVRPVITASLAADHRATDGHVGAQFLDALTRHLRAPEGIMTEADLIRVIVDGLAQIAPESDPERLRGDQPIRATLDIDSFDFLTFLIGLHKSLGVDIPEADYGQLSTLDSMVRYLLPKMPR